MLEGALILLAGIVAGRWLPSRRKDAAGKPPRPLCGCTHHHSFHDPATGECHASVNVPTSYDSYGIARAMEQAPCACRQYSGPVPLPEVYAPEIGG